MSCAQPDSSFGIARRMESPEHFASEFAEGSQRFEEGALLVDRFIIHIRSGARRIVGYVRIYLERPAQNLPDDLQYKFHIVVRLVDGKAFLGTFQKDVCFARPRVFEDLYQLLAGVERVTETIDADEFA